MPGKRTFACVGLGNFGSTVARELVRFGNDVIGIDADQRAADRLAEDLTQVMIADARDEDSLRDCGLADCDAALISLGGDIEASVLAAMNIKLIGIDKVWAKAVSRTHHRILTRLGVDRVIRPDDEVGKSVAQVLHNPLVHDFVALGNGLYMVNALIPDSLEDKRLADLDLGGAFDIKCLGLMRGQDYIAPDPDEKLACDDQLLLLGMRQSLRDFAGSL